MNTHKIVIVTGAGRGTGAATAKLFASQNYSVCINYRSDKQSANLLAEALRKDGTKCITVQADASCRVRGNTTL